MQTNRTTLKPDPARVQFVVDLASRKHALVRAAQDRVDDLRKSLQTERRERDRIGDVDQVKSFGAEHVKTRTVPLDKKIADLTELLAQANSDLRRASDEFQATARLKKRVVEHARQIGIFVPGEEYSGGFTAARSSADA